MTIRRFTVDEAIEASAWAYELPYDIYSSEPSRSADYLADPIDGLGYYAILDTSSSTVIGFCCFGPEARVSGQKPIDGTIDVGGGVRPDLLSNGIATNVLPAVLEFARRRFEPDRFRTAIASFNERSTRLCTSAGFEVTRTFDGPGRQFRELVRPA